MSENPEYKPVSRTKGFARLIFDFADAGRIATVFLQNGMTFEGKLLNEDAGILAMIVYRDRYDYDYVYLPLNNIAGIAVNKNNHP